MSEIKPNTIINDRYSLGAEIGQGGMGKVFKGQDLVLKRDVAIKVLNKGKLGTEGQSRLLHEAQLVAKLDHPNIGAVFDAGDYEGAPYIVMQYVRGQNLSQRPPESAEEIVRISLQICAALDHAHKNDIIHRDLKPENVILDSENNARLLDFGLAQSIASRMTSEGTIMGTVFYMAPEQVMGQSLDGRVDLYALGVLLYELFTGDLPFTADDPVAVISQHLHAPIVPPKVKNENTPPLINNLIIRLMSKNPDERPHSAIEVTKILEAPNILEMDSSLTQELTALDRIVRGQIIGRQKEFDVIRNHWQKVSGLQGQALLISGEPGIGKTRLMHEAIAFVEASGGQAFVGEAYAESNMPYGAFAQIIRGALKRYSYNNLDLPDSVIADLLVLVPDIAHNYPNIPENAKINPEAEQIRLFENIVTFLQTLSKESPLLIIVDDIHWADGGALQLFKHLIRRTIDCPIMLMATYREVELDEVLQFNQMLMELSRHRLGNRLKLDRLGKEQARDMLAAIFQEEITDEFLEGIYKETDGNPFFIEEIARALINSGKLFFENGRWVRPEMEDLDIPQGIRVAVQRRVNQLSLGTADVLLVAAIIGREFDYPTLQKVIELSEDKLIDALEESIKAQVIRELKSKGVEIFSFVHALVPASIIDGVSGLRRSRLHRKIAAAIEELRPEDFSALAHHYGEGGDEERGIEYSIKSAKQAQEVFANDDAIYHYSEVLAMLDESDPRRFGILGDRAKVYQTIGLNKEQKADVDAMLDIAESKDDDLLRVEALIELGIYYRNITPFKAENPLEKAAALANKIKAPALEGIALTNLGLITWQFSNYSQSVRYLEKAIECGREAKQPSLTAQVLSQLSITLRDVADYVGAENAANEALKIFRELGDKGAEGTALRRKAFLKTWKFQKDDNAFADVQKALAIHQEIGDLIQICDNLFLMGLLHAADGDSKKAKGKFQDCLDLGHRIEYNHGIWSATVGIWWFCDLPGGEYQNSIEFLKQEIEFSHQIKDKYSTVTLTIYLAYMYMLLGNIELYMETLDSIFRDYDDHMNKGVRLELQSQISLYQVIYNNDEQGLETLADILLQTNESNLDLNMITALLNLAKAKLFLGGEENLRSCLEQISQSEKIIPTPYITSIRHFLELNHTAAKAYLALGELDMALEHSEKTVRVYLNRIFSLNFEHKFYTHNRILRALDRQKEADEYLLQAYERVMLVASKFTDVEMRKNWLESVKENVDIQREFKERGLQN